jgi:N-acetylmuramoyl-L-alanine amidase
VSPEDQTEADTEEAAKDKELLSEIKEEPSDTVLPEGLAGGALYFGKYAVKAAESGLLEETENETETEQESMTGGPLTVLLRDYIGPREASGQHWAVSYEDLESGKVYGYHDADIMQSASVVKVFIMGAVYQYICYPDQEGPAVPYRESYEGQLRDLISSMITISDNGAANSLIEILGQGDFQKGVQLIGQFCERYGYTGTSIGRRFLESNPSGDNYTSAHDCRKILSDICSGRLVNEEASAKMLEFLKNQTRRGKIPAGLPQGYSCANKTGEMPEGYGLGCIENDMAVVWPPQGMGEGYILVILSDHLGGDNGGAISAFVNMSAETARWYAAEHN